MGSQPSWECTLGVDTRLKREPDTRDLTSGTCCPVTRDLFPALFSC